MAENDTGHEANHPFAPSKLPGPGQRKKREVPDGLWMRCEQCESMLFRKSVRENQEVCPECNHHFRMGGRDRLNYLLDTDTFEELFNDIYPADPLDFQWGGKTYLDRLEKERKKSGFDEAVLTGVGYVKGRRAAVGILVGDFLMGSLGSVMGEKLCLLIEHATERKLPLVIVSMSGGARMHEGALSLMQMAKTSAALARYDDSGGLYISVLTDPTTGGTTASFAMLGDIIIAEPKALIGFAGPRVIRDTIKADLPVGFQRAEFLQEKGFVDFITHRHDLRDEISRLIDYCCHYR